MNKFNSVYGWEKRGGKYFVYINGVRFQISKETYNSKKL